MMGQVCLINSIFLYLIDFTAKLYPVTLCFQLFYGCKGPLLPPLWPLNDPLKVPLPRLLYCVLHFPWQSLSQKCIPWTIIVEEILKSCFIERGSDGLGLHSRSARLITMGVQIYESRQLLHAEYRVSQPERFMRHWAGTKLSPRCSARSNCHLLTIKRTPLRKEREEREGEWSTNSTPSKTETNNAPTQVDTLFSLLTQEPKVKIFFDITLIIQHFTISDAWKTCVVYSTAWENSTSLYLLVFPSRSGVLF